MTRWLQKRVGLSHKKVKYSTDCNSKSPTAVGHGERERPVVPQIAVELVLKLSPPDRLAARAVAQRISLPPAHSPYHHHHITSKTTITTSRDQQDAEDASGTE